MNIETIMEFFYKRVSDRVREKVKNSNKTYAEIYKTDTKLISRIVNNKRTRVNPFLVTDAVVSSSIKDEQSGAYIKVGLLHILDFENEKEILWGTDEEIKSYLPKLFKLLWGELTNEDLEKQTSKDFILCDYVPYAENRTYYNLLFSNKHCGPFLTLYGRYEDDIIDKYEAVEEAAIDYLYFKCAKDFENLFNSFCSKTNSFHKIDKTLKDEFIYKGFIDLIKQNIPNEHSLGIRVKTIIESDLSQSADLIVRYAQTQQIDKMKQKLINAASTYAVTLEEIQKDIIENKKL